MQGSESPRRVDKPWGHELWFAHNDRYAGKLLAIAAGECLSVQYHEKKDETSYLLSGKLLLSRGESAESMAAEEVEAGASWHTPPGVVHRVEAIEDSVVVEVSTPELDDVVRLSDRYGRAGDGSEEG